MPVVTRSCGRQGVRRRIEDITPRRAQTVVKKRKEPLPLSDEDDQQPAKKKTNSMTVSVPLDNLGITPKATKLKSKIPQPKKTAKKSLNLKNSQANDLQQSKANIPDKEPNQDQKGNETPSQKTPVAARTRSFSALKRSYIAKKSQRERMKLVENADSPEKLTSDLMNKQEGKNSEDIISNNGRDVEMRKDHAKFENVISDEEDGNEYYKVKFHGLLEHMKSIQETFVSAQKNAAKNIEAYDALIKELKDGLEKEKNKAIESEKELQKTKDQLLDAKNKLNQQASDSHLLSDQAHGCKEKVDNFYSMINFYKMLSGISLTEESDSVESFQSYRCVYKPLGYKGKAMQFRLTYDKEIEEVEFSPIVQSPTTGEFLQKMPKYLRENIYFSTDQAPGFLLRLIQSYQKQH